MVQECLALFIFTCLRFLKFLLEIIKTCSYKMSLYPFDTRSHFFVSPMERMMTRIFDDALRDFQRSPHNLNPYWLQQPMLNEVNIGNAVGSVSFQKPVSVRLLEVIICKV